MSSKGVVTRGRHKTFEALFLITLREILRGLTAFLPTRFTHYFNESGKRFLLDMVKNIFAPKFEDPRTPVKTFERHQTFQKSDINSYHKLKCVQSKISGGYNFFLRFY